MGVEVVKAVEDLPCHVSKFGFGESSSGSKESLKCSRVHVLHEDGEVPRWLFKDLVAADDVGGVGATEDVHLAEELAAGGGVSGVVAMDELKCVDGRCSLVADFIDGSAVSTAEYLDLFEVAGGDGAGG